MKNYSVAENLNQILEDIDTVGGFWFKFFMVLGLSLTFLVSSIVLFILAPFSAYKKTKRQKELNAESAK